MNIVKATHQLAMDTSTLADASKAKGFALDAVEFYKKAFELEKKAASMTSADDADPMPHFILMRSAAALAFKAGLFQECEEIMEQCLAENPPAWVLADFQEIKALMLPGGTASFSLKSWEIEGILTNVLANESQVTIQDTNLSQSFTVQVPRDIFPKIVKKHWAKKVSVMARLTPHGVMVLERIRAAA